MKDLNIASKLRQLKPGETFEVKTNSERISCLRVAKTMTDCELIVTQISTRRNKKPKTGYTVFAT